MIYPTRYAAKKAALGHEVVVKVEGGYVIMSVFNHNVWKKQK